MTQNELFMYDILGRISSTDAPIVFKGGLITKLILAEKQFTEQLLTVTHNDYSVVCKLLNVICYCFYIN